MSFKKFSLIFLFFSAIASFFVWKHYQDERIKKEKDDYYNSIYSYSGDYEIGDYVFLGDKGLVAQWVSKNPEEDKEIRKHIKNDPKRKVEYSNDDVITMGERFIIRKNIKTMSIEKGESTYRLLIYDTKDQTLRKKEIDMLKWLHSKGDDWNLDIGPYVAKTSDGREVLLINIAKYVEKTINGKRDSERVVEAYYVDLEAGKVIDFQQGGKKIESLYYSINKDYQGENLPGDILLKLGIDFNYNTVNFKKEFFKQSNNLPIQKEYPKAYQILQEKNSAYYPTFNNSRSPKDILNSLSPLIPQDNEILQDTGIQ
ncbi:hypothetical protein QM894_02980 [Streptococcus cristatus]|uniref:hypothetical protein n=1 Tax=Streptococcus cristatus TaxID=45634 RepID=UPI0039C3B74D